jgi:hypothetical protein
MSPSPSMGDLPAVLPAPTESLASRREYLRSRRRQASRLGDRGAIFLWVALGTLIAWLFVAGVAGLAH